MRVYYYFFYKIYCFWENAPIKFWSHFKAGVTIIFLEIWFMISLLNYYNVFINKQFYLSKNIFLSIGILIVSVNITIFTYLDLWREYNKKFDQLSKKKNIIGGVVVWGIIVFIIANTVYSFYLMSLIDWKQYQYIR